jgi:hypothetical protein
MMDLGESNKDLFQYTALQHPWQLRLLEFFPRNESEPIRAKMHVFPAADAKQIDANHDGERGGAKAGYVALSYTWGDPTDKHDIEIGGKVFFITANLYEFLWQWTLDKENLSQYIWIDAISIDQRNISERNNQVGRMTSIYESADYVIIWLGPEAENSDLAMRGLLVLAGEITVAKEVPAGSPNPIFKARSTGIAAPELHSTIMLDQNFTRAVTELLQRSWWTRVWVIQEATVPSQRYPMFCGSMWIGLGSFIKALNTLQRLLSEYPELKSLRSSIFDLNGMARYHWRIHDLRKAALHPTQLFELVSIGREFDASDNRDHIYGFLGMLGPQCLPFLSPDYGKSVYEVYQDFTQYLILECPYGHNLDVLGHAVNATSKSVSALATFDELGQMYGSVQRCMQSWMSGDADNIHTELGSLLNTLFNKLQPAVLEIWKDPEFVELMKGLFPSMYSAYRSLGTMDVDSFLNLVETARSSVFADREDSGNANGSEETRQAQAREQLEDGVRILTQFKPLIESGPVSIPEITNVFAPMFDLIGVQLSSSLNSDTLVELAKVNTRKIRLACSWLPLTHSKVVEAPEGLLTRSVSQETTPSWVPIWHKSLRHVPFYKRLYGSGDGENFAYSASGRDPQPFLQGVSALAQFNGRELQVQGFRVDVIKHIDPLTFSDNHGFASSDEDVWAKMQDLLDPDIQTYEATNESMVDALWRTVLADIAFEADKPVRRLKRGKENIENEIANGNSGKKLNRSACSGRSLATTAGNTIGLVPRLAQVDDEIFVLGGGQVLFVLRPLDGQYQYVGESYVHGMMDGEALRRLRDFSAKADTIRIV